MSELLDTRVEVAARLLGALATRDVPLGPMTTYKVGGSAALFVRPASVSELSVVADAVRASDLPVLVVGRGSNLLVADEGFGGIAISLGAIGSDIRLDAAGDHETGAICDDHAAAPGEQRLIAAGGAVALPVLARRTVAAGLAGFEWAVGVPGSIGGGVRMNAGGPGSGMAACLVDVDVFDLHQGRRATLPAGRLGLRFRGSELGDHQVVLSARLRLRAGDPVASSAELEEIVRWRREHQPGGQNAGSVFVNPVPGEVTAGELIDRLGLRGMRIGTAHVSDKHANFIQGTEGGTSRDVLAVIEHVRRAVAEGTGFLLRSEVRLVGFGDLDTERGPGVAL
jgi:UDP-N-acetylmuramate dehydrogenase